MVSMRQVCMMWALWLAEAISRSLLQRKKGHCNVSVVPLQHSLGCRRKKKAMRRRSQMVLLHVDDP
eukprot:10348000-Ditylum_brightwellii.AAC.1